MIIGKSNHPVEVKKIRLKVWRLRHEVEKAIETRKVECRTQDIPEYYDDIDFFYNHKTGSDENVVQIGGEGSEVAAEATLQPEVGEIDDDMLAMQAALTGGEESKDEESKDEESKDEESKDEESKDEESKDEEPKDEESKDEESKDEVSKDEESKDENNSEKTEEEILAEAAAMMMDDSPPAADGKAKAEEVPKEAFNPSIPIKEIPKNADETLEFHLTFPRTIPDEELLASCFCFLADVDMTSIRVFSTKPFTYGQTVVVDFQIPIRFQLVGEVKNCHNLNMKTRIISETKPNYRLLIKFGFKRPGERTNLRKFLKSVEPDIPAPVKKKKENPDEELDELDF